MLSNKEVEVLARQCREYIASVNGGVSKASISDLCLLVKCRETNNYNPMFRTVLYTKKRDEYPVALFFVKSIDDGVISGSVHKFSGIACRLTSRTRGGVPNAIRDYVYDSVEIENLIKQIKASTDCRPSIFRDTFRSAKVITRILARTSTGGSVEYLFDYGKATEYYPQSK